MNATMIKGERSKLLAVAFVLAMVVCAFAAIMPADDVSAADVSEVSTGATELDPEIHSASLTIGSSTTYYETLVGAWDVAVNQTEKATITLLKDETGDGLKTVSDKNADVTLDLGGHTYTATTDPAGSSGTENQGMQLLKGNTFLIMNGTFKTVTGEDGKMKNGINVYCDAEFRDVDMDFSESNGVDPGFNGLQLANGKVLLTGTTSIKERAEDYAIAFFANWKSYTGGSQVVINTTGSIDGIIAVAEYQPDENCGKSSLTITNMATTANTYIEYATNYAFDLNIAENMNVDVKVPENTKVSGNISFGANEVELSDVTAGTGGLTLSEGSVVISGTITSDATITADGEVVIDGVTVSGESAELTVETVADGTSNVTIKDLTISEDASLDIQTNVTVEKLENNGSISIADQVTVDGRDKIINNGIMYSQGADANVAEVGNAEAFETALENSTEIHLSADITYAKDLYGTDGSKVTVYLSGHNLTTDGNVNLANLTIDVSAGSTFTPNKNVFNVTDDRIVTYVGSIFDKGQNARLFTDRPSDSVLNGSAAINTEIRYPYLAEGSIAIGPDGYKYVIAHGSRSISGEGSIQYGIDASGLVYDGTDKAITYTNSFPVESFDNYYTAARTPVTVVVLPNEAGKVDAGIYQATVTVTMDSPTGTVPVYDTLMIEVNPANPTVSVDIEDWVYGKYNDQTNAIVPSYTGVTIGGVTYDYDDFVTAGGEVTYKFFTKSGETYTLMQDVTDENYSELKVGTYYVKAYFTAVKNYDAAESGYAEFQVKQDELLMGISAVDENTIVDIKGVGDKPVSYYQDIKIKSVTDPESDCQYKISGTLNYVTGNTIYGGEQQSGYYLVFNITNGHDFEVPYYFTVNDDERKYGNTVDPGSELMIVWIPDVTDLDNLQITFELDNYEKKVITICVSELYRNTAAGYNADEAEAEQQMISNGILTDAEKGDIGAMTMWMAFDTKGAATAQAYLYYGDSETPIYSQEMKDPAPTGRWYFSFDPQNGSYIGLNKVNPCLDAFNDYVEAYGNAAPGAYTMEIVLYGADGAKIGTVTSVAYIEGEVDSGFEYFESDAETGIKDAYKDSDYTFDKTDVDDKTLWFTWYQGQDYDNIVITVSKDGVVTTYTEPKDGFYDLKAGLHTFYASFNNQLSDFADDPLGTYTITVKAGDKVIAEGDVPVNAVDSDFAIGALEDEYLGKAPQEYMDITFGALNEGKYIVTGEVFYLDAWDDYWTGAETAGYYIGIVITDAEGNPIDAKYWANATGSVDNGNNTLLTQQPKEYAAGDMDGIFILYLGNVEDLTALKDITVSIDLDGTGKFLNPTTYTLGLDLTAGTHTYTATYIDEPYGYGVTYIYNDKYAVLPSLPDVSKDAYGWYVKGTEGAIFTAGTLVDLSQIDADTDYELEFVATYVTDVRDQYTVSIDSVDTENGQIVISTVSDQVSDVANGIVYRNLTANHYYVISVLGDNGSERIVASNAITNGGFGSSETLTISGLKLAEGDLITVYFYADYVENFPAFGSDSYTVPTETSEPVVGFDADADAVEQAIADAYEELGYTEVPELTAVENTAFVVFETSEEYNDVPLRAYVFADGDSPADSVYTEDMTFSDAGAHVFYFTFTGVNSNTDAGVDGVISADVTVGETYTILIATQSGTPVYYASVTYQTAQTA